MKQEAVLNPNSDSDDNDMEVEFTSTDNITTDIVEDFARQLDEVVRIQDAQGDDDEDEENDDDIFGYQQLRQDDDDEGDEMYQQLQSEEEEEEEEAAIKNPLDIDLEPSARLNPETSDLIKSIMTNIQLSNDAVPEWAKKIPESAWLPRVVKKDD